MPDNKPSPLLSSIMSFVFFGAGLAIIFVAMDIIPLDDSQFSAPRWVVAAAGGLFSMAGIMIFTGERWPWVNGILGVVLVFTFGCIGGWVALYGAAEGFSINGNSGLGKVGVLIARIAFGTGSVICFMVVIGAISSSIIKLFRR